MAYDRFDPRFNRPEQSRYGRDRWSEDNRPRSRDDRDERGFFERAGDEIASWFGGDDAERRRDRDERSERGYDWDGDRSRYGARSPSRDEGRYAYRSSSDVAGSSRYRPAGSFDRGVRDYSQRSEGRSFSERGRSEDPHYMSWRQQQLDELDRDYDDYRRENQSRFESEFSNWRQGRMQKRSLLGQAQEHMEVVGNEGEHVGTIDHVMRDRLVLTKSDPESGGRHHAIDCRHIDRIEDGKVVLDCSKSDAQKSWIDENRSRALFEREDQGQDGPHILGRSFEGTYR